MAEVGLTYSIEESTVMELPIIELKVWSPFGTIAYDSKPSCYLKPDEFRWSAVIMPLKTVFIVRYACVLLVSSFSLMFDGMESEEY